MPIQIIPYTADWIPEVKAFNLRLAAGNVSSRFPESEVPLWLPKSRGNSIYQEYFLAVEGGRVRGAYILKHQDFVIDGETVNIGNYQLPLSEGIIDRSYTAVGLLLLKDALRRHPLLYSLGIGGFDQPLSRMLKSMSWSINSVPFFAKIASPTDFFREIKYLRNSTVRTKLFDLLSFTRLGWCAVKLQQLLTIRLTVNLHELSVEQVSSFGTWADELFDSSKKTCSMSAVRSSTVLTVLYPDSDKRFVILKISANEVPVGWVVLLATDLRNHKHFGNMRLGSIVDNIALPGYEAEVIAVAERWLKTQQVDLIVSNQAHKNWVSALDRNRFFRGPSNFLLATSPELTKKLEPLVENLHRIHMNRGDGDGPIHL